MNNLNAMSFKIPACAGMTILVLESANLSLVEEHLFALDQSQEVFDYAQTTTAVLNLMI